MAKSRKRQDGETPAADAPQPATGRQAIHGDIADYGDRVSQRAYELYLARGGADGQDFDDWLAAERELTNDREGDHRE
jgi:DUF2934 family protein